MIRCQRNFTSVKIVDIENEEEKSMEVENQKIKFSGTVDKALIKKTMLKAFLGAFVPVAVMITMATIIIYFEVQDIVVRDRWIVFPTKLGVGVLSLTLIIANLTAGMFVKNFHYEITDQYIIIKSGVFTKSKTTIPFSRIQNISIVQGVFDRMFDLHTIKIETAGKSGYPESASAGLPEGYMPGIRDTTEIEKVIKKLVNKYTQEPMMVEGQAGDYIFKDNNVAFDEFVSYFLSKVEEAKNMKTRVKELRTAKNLTQKDLADKAGVSRQTINYLEQGKYLPSLPLAFKLAKLLGVSVENLFELDDETVENSNE